MPVFGCLGKHFQLSEADLARAPGSILAEAWGASTGNSAVSLDRWPRPDLNVLKVGTEEHTHACTHPLGAQDPCAVARSLQAKWRSIALLTQKTRLARRLHMPRPREPLSELYGC